MSDQPNQPENDDHEFTDDDAPDAPPKKKGKKIPKSKQRALRVATPTDIPAEEAAWRNSLRYNEDGTLTKDPGNAALLMINDSRWKGAVRYDEFADRVRWYRDAPALTGMPAPKEGRNIDETAITFVQHWLRRIVGPAFSREATKAALLMAAQANSFHPVQDFLRGLRWDGTKRLATWLPKYLGTRDDDYHAQVGRMWLVSAVARAMKPGCKVDHMLVLEGSQEALKSTALRILAGDGWLLEGRLDLRDPVRSGASIQGKWIVEVAELQAFKGASIYAVKEWVTLQVDSFRGAYQEFDRDRPRQCVFAGTTNEDRYLVDPTGARRFWPVRCADTINVAALRQDRDQLWAEAFETFMGGQPVNWSPDHWGAWSWWPERANVELRASLRAEQDARHDQDEWEAKVAPWVTPGVTVGEILGTCLAIEPAKWDRAAQTRVGAILHRLGWRAMRSTLDGERARRYYPLKTT